jgi:hypothetical protein
MRPGNLVPSFYFYKLADALSSPYTALTAYSAGLIDAQGNVLKPESSIDPFEYLVIKLKKIFDQLPYGMTRARLGNYLSTLQMFSEEVENFDITQEQFHCLVEGFVTQHSNGELSYLELLEDMATGGGAGALGVPAQGGNINQGGISGFDPPLGMPIQRRKQPKYFDNCEIFEVCPEEFLQLKAARTWKEVPEGDTKNYLQRFQRRNKGGKIAVKSLNPLSAEHELHWITYPAKNFMEDVDLSFFSELLTETNEVDPDQFDSPDAGSKADSAEVALGQVTKQMGDVSKAREQKKGYTPPRSFPDDPHKEFIGHMKHLMFQYADPSISKGKKTEIEGRMLFHAKAYHMLKDNHNELQKYINRSHSIIHSSPNANDYELRKEGDSLFVRHGNDGITTHPLEIKGKGGNLKDSITNEQKDHLIKNYGHLMPTWVQGSTPHPVTGQRFTFHTHQSKKLEEEFKAALDAEEADAIKEQRISMRHQILSNLKARPSHLVRKIGKRFYYFGNPTSSDPKLRLGWSGPDKNKEGPERRASLRMERNLGQNTKLNGELVKITQEEYSPWVSSLDDASKTQFEALFKQHH